MRIFQFLTISLLLLSQQALSQGPQNNNNNYCPSSCNASSGNGKCSSTQRQCVCNEGYFDTDCSKKITKLTNGVSQTITISPQDWGYFYISLATVPGDAVITFLSSASTIYYSLLLEGPDDFYLPSDYYTPSLTAALSAYQTSQTITIKSSTLSLSDGGWLLIGGGNTDSTNSITLTVTNTWNPDDSSSSPSLVLIIAIAVGVSAFILVCLITGYTCRKRRMMREREQVQQGENQNGNRLPSVQGRPQQNASAFLKKEELDVYFPIKNFTDIKKSFDQTSCSICLEEYNPAAVCRQLYCEHIFHGECIEEWLAKHTECPNCKCEITKAAIKEHIKKANAESKAQAEAQAQQIHQIANKQDASYIVEIPEENIANSPTRVGSGDILAQPQSP